VLFSRTMPLERCSKAVRIDQGEPAGDFRDASKRHERFERDRFRRQSGRIDRIYDEIAARRRRHRRVRIVAADTPGAAVVIDHVVDIKVETLAEDQHRLVLTGQACREFGQVAQAGHLLAPADHAHIAGARLLSVQRVSDSAGGASWRKPPENLSTASSRRRRLLVKS
jgi:hypothetical protein